jgi:4'-phosphopantetheinyl transferase
MSDVYVLLVSATEPDVIPAHMLSALTPDENARAARFFRSRDRWLFVLGRALVHHGLRERFGITQARLHVPAGGGKPTLDPPRDGIDFSLSHTQGYVACAFGRGCELGIDVERHDRAVEAEGIAGAYFAAAERELLHHTDPSGRGEVFLRLWALKEAVVKATGTGLLLDLASFAVAFDPPRLQATAPELGDVRRWQLHDWRLQDATRLALAVRRRDEQPLAVTFAEVPLADVVANRQRSELAR